MLVKALVLRDAGMQSAGLTHRVSRPLLIRSAAMNVTPGPLIGQPVGRAEDPRFFAGTGQFIGGLRREGCGGLSQRVARRIRRVDTAAARKLEGVHSVITAVDVGEKITDIRCASPTWRNFKATFSRSSRTTRCAMSANPSRWLSLSDARSQRVHSRRSRSASRRSRRWRTDMRQPRADPLLFEGAGSNRAARYVVRFGDTDAALARADDTRREKAPSRRARWWSAAPQS